MVVPTRERHAGTLAAGDGFHSRQNGHRQFYAHSAVRQSNEWHRTSVFLLNFPRQQFFDSTTTMSTTTTTTTTTEHKTKHKNTSRC